MNKKSTLKLDKKQVNSCLSIEEAIECVESAFTELGKNHAQVPSKKYLFFDQYNGDYRSMPGYLEEEDVAGCKLVNSHPGNKDLPTVMALLVLVDPKNGFPFCLMDATALTSYRTGAAGAVATKHLARKNSSRLGFVGAGVQAHYQFLAINQVLDIDKAFIYDLSKESAEDLKNLILNEDVKAEICDEIKDLVPKVDILVTTTPVKETRMKKDWLNKGGHINAIGADAKGKKELESQVLKDAKIVVEQLETASHAGEINVPLRNGEISETDIYSELSEIVIGEKQGRKNEEEITVFDSTGLAIQDVATGYRVYKNAIDEGIGEEINLI